MYTELQMRDGESKNVLLSLIQTTSERSLSGGKCFVTLSVFILSAC